MNLFDADGNPQALPYPESISFAMLPTLTAGRSVGAGHTSRPIDTSFSEISDQVER